MAGGIAIVGEREIVAGFAALGLEVFPVSRPEEASAALERALRAGFSIVFLSETFAGAREVSEFRGSSALVLIPGRDGASGAGRTALKSAVQRAAGADIL